MPGNNLVCFNNLLVNAVTFNSGIFVGTNTQLDWHTNNNNKFGFGTITGTGNIISRAVNIFNDNDILDTPIITQKYITQPPVQNVKPGSAESPKSPQDREMPDKEVT